MRAVRHGRRQIAGLNGVAAGKNHQPLDHVFQFADVAGPGVVDQHIEGFPGKGRLFQAERPCETIQEIIDQQRDVFASLAQRGQLQGHDVQPVIKILAKVAIGDGILQVAIRGAEHADIHLNGFVAAQSLEGLLLQESQDLGLDQQGNIADLIEKDLPPSACWNFPMRCVGGAGKSPGLVSKKFAFQESLGNRLRN